MGSIILGIVYIVVRVTKECLCRNICFGVQVVNHYTDRTNDGLTDTEWEKVKRAMHSEHENFEFLISSKSLFKHHTTCDKQKATENDE